MPQETAADPPPGTTYVLYFTPPGCPDYAAWYLVPVTDWCGDRPPREWTFLGTNKAARDLGEEYCAGFAGEVLGFRVCLTRFEYEDPGTRRRPWRRNTEPAYWLSPAPVRS
jgi:hypothetical protein